MILSDTAIRRPVLTLVVLIVLMLFGTLATRNMGIDIVPNVVVPYVSVIVVYPGASPEEIETSVARPIEDAAVQVDGLKHMTTTCANNFCQVMLEFNLDVDQNVAADDIRAKIAAIEGDLPSGAEKPQVQKYDVNAIPVVTLALTGEQSVDELYDYADDRLSGRLSTVAGVASVELIGGEEREVVVTVDRAKLAACGLTLAQVVDAVGKGNLKIPSGQLPDHAREFSVMFDAEARGIEDLGRIEIGTVRGTRIYLRDVATFAFGTKRKESIASFDGRPAVLMRVTKRGEANAAKTVDGLREIYKMLVDGLPGGMRLDWVRDDGAYVAATVKGGVDAIWQGVLLTGFVLLLFLADWRMALTAFVSIPVTIVISLVAFSLFGYTANIITMNAIGISVGILVANSIVVLENIARRNGDAASALTNIVVFLPIATMRTMAGRFFVPFAIVITAATFASLFVSFTLTPILSSMFAGRGAGVNRALTFVLAPWNACYNATARFYRATLFPALRHPVLLIAAVAVLSAAGFAYLVPRLQLDFIPTMDKGEMTVRLEYPADTALEKTAERTLELARKIGSLKDSAGDPLAQSVTISVGKTQGILGAVSQGAYLAEIAVKLKDMTARRETIQDVAERLRDVCREEPDVIWSALVPLVIGGSAQSAEFRILGDDFDTLNAAGLATARDAAADPSCADVSHSIRIGRPETRLYPQRAVLNDLGVTPSSLCA